MCSAIVLRIPTKNLGKGTISKACGGMQTEREREKERQYTNTARARFTNQETNDLGVITPSNGIMESIDPTTTTTTTLRTTFSLRCIIVATCFKILKEEKLSFCVLVGVCACVRARWCFL